MKEKDKEEKTKPSSYDLDDVVELMLYGYEDPVEYRISQQLEKRKSKKNVNHAR